MWCIDGDAFLEKFNIKTDMWNALTDEKISAKFLLYNQVADVLEKMPTVTPEPEWISVKDRMPRNEEMVVCYTPCDGYMFVGFHRTYVSANYDWSAWYIITAMRSTKKITKKVTHWMRLPKPPKEEEE